MTSVTHTTSPPERRRLEIRVAGIVQGVGFRPFVHGLATRLGLAGLVTNASGGVVIEVEGAPEVVSEFMAALPREAPPLAVIEGITETEIPSVGGDEFTIGTSDGAGAMQTLISPDVATCTDCLRETADPTDRRHHYPFTNCTNCGPRFTIVRDVPYDRPFTTMAGFEMCEACAVEYHDPADRRFHAQPVCCPDCGPTLSLADDAGNPVGGGDPLDAAAEMLAGGQVVAVKGLGGFHLAVDAANETAVATLRSRKFREDKPFAVMVADLEAARRLCEVDDPAAELLASPARPIVLIPRRSDAPVAPSVAPGNRSLGVMLPYTPLHHLLLDLLSDHTPALVLTSGNASDEPIAFRDDDARARLAAIADAFLVHDRAIHTRVDDSVVRMAGGEAVPVRRSRGYVPQPVSLGFEVASPILACGAELKNTFALARGHHAFLSHHVGDLENYETFRSFTDGIEHFERLFEIRPELVAHDLHPEYLSTKYALELAERMTGVERVGIQHHHAHVASCLADNQESGPVIGVAFDGLGYGPDDTIWGGEFLVADLGTFERVGHLETVPMPGGTAAIREPWRMAAAYLDRLGAASDDHEVARRNAEPWGPVLDAARVGLNAPLTSSMGRLFDAVAALVGLRDRVNYEGQAAIDLEQAAGVDEDGSYPVRVEGERPFRVQGPDLVAAVLDDLGAGVEVGTIAGRFHHAVTALIVDGCRRARGVRGLDTVALSGGVFQNALLVERTVPALEAAGFRVLTHRRVPPNDGGVSLGQVAVAAATRARDDTGCR